MSHLKRSSITKSKKFFSYIIFFIGISFLGVSPFKVFKLYKSGKIAKFPEPNFALVYNKYWEGFHINLLGWNNSNYIHLGVFDLSRNILSRDGDIK